METLNAIGEKDGARVIYCADSVDNHICGSVQRVLSSEGPAIGFNALNQSEVLLESPENRAYFNHFLRHPIVLLVVFFVIAFSILQCS